MAREGSRLHRFGRFTGSLAAISLLFAAGSASASARAYHASHPKVRGSYSFTVNDPPDCLDPQKTAAASSSTVDSYVLDSLLSIDAKGHFVGNLATSYKVSKGGTVLTFKLRHGVKFSNGDPFTAADVKYTFDRAVNPATKSPVSATQLADVTATKVLGKYTVALELKAPNRVILYDLAGSYLSILDPRATQAGNTCNVPIGTGAYKVQSDGTAFSDVTLVTNKYHKFAPNWVHNHGNPYIPKLQIVTIPSEDTAISDLITGAVSMAAIPGDQLSRVKGNKHVVLHKLPANNLIFLNFNLKHKPFNNPAVRRAVDECLDRKNIVKAALGGLGTPVADPLAPAYKPYFDKAAAKYLPSFNIKAAAKVFKKYHAQGPYSLLVTDVAPFSTIAEILQADLGAAGMKVNIDSVGDLGTFLTKANAGDFDMSSLNYSYGDADVMTYLLHTKDKAGSGFLNWSGYSNKAVDKLLGEEETTLSIKKAVRYFAQLQIIINKQAPFLGIASQTVLLGVRSNIKGFHIDSEGGYAAQDVYIG